MDNVSADAILKAISDLRTELRSDLSDFRSEVRSDQREHGTHDEVRFRQQGDELKFLRTAHDKATGFLYAIMVLQGLVVTVLTVVQIIHLTKGH